MADDLRAIVSCLQIAVDFNQMAACPYMGPKSRGDAVAKPDGGLDLIGGYFAGAEVPVLAVDALDAAHHAFFGGLVRARGGTMTRSIADAPMFRQRFLLLFLTVGGRGRFRGRGSA